LVVALVACAGIIGFLGSSVPYWHQMLIYALSEHRTMDIGRKWRREGREIKRDIIKRFVLP
jgi:ABC-type cobalamin transport system permease subunit